MPDHPINELPRVVLVYGQDQAVAHVRDALQGHVDVVYAVPAGEFDVARMHDTRASAALVNLDDGDWLDDIETRLEQAGVAVVYNDPEISRDREGWERARWLRHLVAKLRGSSDFDPPRPDQPELSAINASVAPAPEIDVSPEPAPTVPDAPLAELPLSPEEIETMTVDLVAEADPASAVAVENAAATNDARADVMAMDLAVEEAAASATKAGRSEPADVEPDTHDRDFNAENALDVDTEALSAMIDARLAESEAQTPSDSPQVWRVASGGAVSPVQLDDVTAASNTSTISDAAPVATPAVVEPAAAEQDDSDVVASLPSLDDWALIDHEAPSEATKNRPGKAPEPALSDSFAGLELVPMETVAPLRLDADPIERWLDDSKPAKAEPANTARASGGKA